MSELCKLCAYEHSDCKGWKGGFSIKCDYYKKPNVFNAKEAAVRIAELQDLCKHLQKQYYELMNKTRWIPVTERLPEEPYGCLVTVMDSFFNGCGWDDVENLLPYFVGYDGESWNDAGGDECPIEVLAWMPLPEPYKEGDTNDKAD